MHVDAEALALIALGEPADPQDAAHVAVCEQCTDEVATLTEVVRAGRSVTPEDALVAPPPEVWGRISDELGLGADRSARSADAPADDEPRASVHTLPTVGPTGSPAGAPTTPTAQDDGTRLAAVIPLRRRAVPWIAAAAAAGVVVGGAGGAWLVGRDTSGVPEVVAEASLEPLPGWDATGEAVVEVAADGGRTLVLELDGETGADAFREVWLIDRDVTRLVSLGVLEGDSGRFTVPSGLDLSDFVVVDVSEEPYDGDPAHSGDSIIRGLLDT